MKRITLYLLIVSSIGMGFFQSCQSTKSATATKMLKFNFENGKGYDYEMITKIDQEIMGQPMKVDMSYYYSMDVSADDGNMKTITTRFDRVKMNMSMAGMDMVMDSDKKPGPGDDKNPMAPVSRILGAISGQRFVMKVNAEGKVQEVTGFKEMAGAIADSLQLDGKDREEMMGEFQKSFDEKEILGQFERMFCIFPNKEVKVGDSWEKINNIAGQMGGKYTSTYTVKEIEGDIVTLEEKSKITGATEGIDMDGNVSGLLVVDSRSGLLVNADQDITIKMDKAGAKITVNAKNKIKGKAR
jgi:hypothetical protein